MTDAELGNLKISFHLTGPITVKAMGIRIVAKANLLSIALLVIKHTHTHIVICTSYENTIVIFISLIGFQLLKSPHLSYRWTLCSELFKTLFLD